MNNAVNTCAELVQQRQFCCCSCWWCRCCTASQLCSLEGMRLLSELLLTSGLKRRLINPQKIKMKIYFKCSHLSHGRPLHRQLRPTGGRQGQQGLSDALG